MNQSLPRHGALHTTPYVNDINCRSLDCSLLIVASLESPGGDGDICEERKTIGKSGYILAWMLDDLRMTTS